MSARLRTGVAIAALVALAGCRPGSSLPVATPSGTPGSSTSTSRVVHLSEPAEGHTVHVGLGDRVVLVLHNTYWRIGPVHGRALRQVGTQVDHPARPGTCRLGVGCGTVRTSYVATAAGAVRLTASRSTCGEAMACPPGEGAFAVRVVVG